ncbi:MAG: hypothetical protein LBP50_01065 [Tannerella sp.]|nr:hypothetical protein [Tannerella sp.]
MDHSHIRGFFSSVPLWAATTLSGAHRRTPAPDMTDRLYVTNGRHGAGQVLARLSEASGGGWRGGAGQNDRGANR